LRLAERSDEAHELRSWRQIGREIGREVGREIEVRWGAAWRGGVMPPETHRVRRSGKG
jgi:hypothetical protein